MKKIKIGINGFGRIGRKIARLLLCHPELELVLVNDLSSISHNAQLFKYDSVHGRLGYSQFELNNNTIQIDNHTISFDSQKEPKNIPWKKYGVDIVFECTGVFCDMEGAKGHLLAGAGHVIISAPPKTNDIPTFVYGVNHKAFDPSMKIISNASCTTNCLAPIAQVLHSAFHIREGLMTTIHSYTNDQRILDLGHSDPRRMRAGALNMIPTTTGAAKSVGLVIPSLNGKLTGLSIRVPTPNVSLVDFVCTVDANVSTKEINQELEKNSQGDLRNILSISYEPLVSTDYNGSTFSSVVDALSTMSLPTDRGSFIKILSWYDNETGFSSRMLDLASYISKSFL